MNAQTVRRAQLPTRILTPRENKVRQTQDTEPNVARDVHKAENAAEYDFHDARMASGQGAQETENQAQRELVANRGER